MVSHRGKHILYILLNSYVFPLLFPKLSMVCSSSMLVTFSLPPSPSYSTITPSYFVVVPQLKIQIQLLYWFESICFLLQRLGSIYDSYLNCIIGVHVCEESSLRHSSCEKNFAFMFAHPQLVNGRLYLQFQQRRRYSRTNISLHLTTTIMIF